MIIQGMRRELKDVVWVPAGKTKKAGYVRQGTLNALYALRMNFLPAAFCHSYEVSLLQRQINEAIRELERKPQKNEKAKFAISLNI